MLGYSVLGQSDKANAKVIHGCIKYVGSVVFGAALSEVREIKRRLD